MPLFNRIKAMPARPIACRSFFMTIAALCGMGGSLLCLTGAIDAVAALPVSGPPLRLEHQMPAAEAISPALLMRRERLREERRRFEAAHPIPADSIPLLMPPAPVGTGNAGASVVDSGTSEGTLPAPARVSTLPAAASSAAETPVAAPVPSPAVQKAVPWPRPKNVKAPVDPAGDRVGWLINILGLVLAALVGAFALNRWRGPARQKNPFA